MMKKIIGFFERLNAGTIFTSFFLLGIFLGTLASNGITLFPFIANLEVGKGLMICLMFFIWSLAGVVFIVRKGEGLSGLIIRLIAILYVIAGMCLALYFFYRIIIHG